MSYFTGHVPKNDIVKISKGGISYIYEYSLIDRHTYMCGTIIIQEVCLQSNVISLCLSQLDEPNSLLQQWLAICLGKLWRKYDAARWCGVRDSAHNKLKTLLGHDIPDVSYELDL